MQRRVYKGTLCIKQIILACKKIKNKIIDYYYYIFFGYKICYANEPIGSHGFNSL